MNKTPDSLQSIEGCFYNDPELPVEVIGQIRAFNEEQSSNLWSHYISSNSRHLMLMSNDEWPVQLLKESKCLGNWQEAWNEDNAVELIPIFEEIGFRREHQLNVFWMRGCSAEMPVAVFYDHWINFLYEDEGVVIICPELGKACIMSNGRIFGGALPNEKCN